MKKQIRKPKGFSPIIAIIAVGAVVVIIAIFLSIRKRAGTQQSSQSVPVIQNAEDLNNVDSELDNTNLNELDEELNQLDTDASTF